MMRRLVSAFLFIVLAGFAAPALAQQTALEAKIKQLVPYSEMLQQDPTMTLQQYNDAVHTLAQNALQQNQTPAPSWRSERTYVAPRYEMPAYTLPPQTGTTYDWRSGNNYSWQHLPNGDTRVNGQNLNTGSMWNTTIKPDGSMQGTDSHFNTWQYDAGSKFYINYGTGKICTGEGYARVCTGGR